MKRVISALSAVCIILYFFVLPIITSAESIVAVTVNDVSGNRGDVVSVIVSVTRDSNLQACSLMITYDKDALEIVTAAKGEALVGTPIINTSISGKILLSYASTSSLASSGSILCVSFRIKNDAPYGNSKVGLSIQEMSDGDFNNIPYSVKSGFVNIMAPKLDSPSNLKSLNIGDTYVDLFWDGNSIATGYIIYLNGTKINEAALTDNYYTINELQQNTEYTIQVSTMYYTTESDLSSPLQIKTLRSKCFVTFVNWDYDEASFSDGMVLGIDSVDYGSTVSAPDVPFREGYTFIGWDKPLTNITSDQIIQAQYKINSYSVRFLDENGDVLKTENVDHGNAATPPSDPVKSGYIFQGWDGNYSSITSDKDFMALYSEDTLTIRFVDKDGKEISTVNGIEKGGTVTAPVAPKIAGYVFKGWDAELTHITESKIITAIYEECSHSFSGWVSNGAETHTHICSVCGQTETENHSFINSIVSPTATEQGYTLHTCKCGYSYKDTYTSPVTEDAPQIVFSSAKTTAGKQIEVTLSLKNNPGIAGLAVSLKYDASVLTLVESKKGSMFSGFTAGKNFAWDESEDVTMDGTLATFVFSVADNAQPGDYVIEVIPRSCTNENIDDVTLTSVNGVVTVIDFIYGDVNGDEKNDMKDVVLLRKYIVNYDYDTETSSVAVEAGADANGDEKIDMKDVVLLRKYIVNYDYDTETSSIVLGPQ